MLRTQGSFKDHYVVDNLHKGGFLLQDLPRQQMVELMGGKIWQSTHLKVLRPGKWPLC